MSSSEKLLAELADQIMAERILMDLEYCHETLEESRKQESFNIEEVQGVINLMDMIQSMQQVYKFYASPDDWDRVHKYDVS